MGGQLPKQQVPKATQIAALQSSISATTNIQSNITKGFIDQGVVNSIVAAAINAMRAGE